MRHYETLPSDYYRDASSARPYRQAALEFVWRHMVRQANPSFSKDLKLPRYNGEGGALCAVGCLVEDRAILPSIEGLDVVDLMKKGRIPTLLLPVDEGFLAGLQLAHDWAWKESVRSDTPWWPLFTAQMAKLATDFGLEVVR